MANIGYIRVSTKEQNTGRQYEDFTAKGITLDKVFEEKMSGKNTDRPQLQAMLSYLREGDTLYVESFSRLARSTRDLLNIVSVLTEKGVSFVSLKENVDTNKQEQMEVTQKIIVSSKKKEKTPYMIWHDDVSEKLDAIYDRNISYKISKDILMEIYEKMTNVYGIVWEQDYKEWRRTHQGVPRTLNIIFNNEQYKSIFESILSDKYDESIANHSDVLSPDELIDELISKRNDKTRAATFKLVYTRMENYYDVKWDKMIMRYKRETGRINVLKKELLYWNRGLVERFRISIHDLLEINW